MLKDIRPGRGECKAQYLLVHYPELFWFPVRSPAFGESMVSGVQSRSLMRLIHNKKESSRRGSAVWKRPTAGVRVSYPSA